ncbi:MAG: hypothetical protein ACRCZ9_06975 [Fusobacteriaceae bacterium]
MIKIIESIRKNSEHLVFNSQFLKILNDFEDYELNFYCRKSHYKQIKKIFDFSRVNYIKLLGNENNGKIKNLLGYLLSFVYDIFLLIGSKKEDILIYTSINPISLYFLRMINSKLNKKIFLICHGELEKLINSNNSNVLQKIYLKVFNLKINDNIEYIILGESIYKNLVKINEIQNKNYIYMDHPYIYNLEKAKFKEEDRKIVKLGTVGVATKEKGSHLIFELAEKLQTKIKNNELEFHIIGKIEFPITNTKLVKYSKNKEMLSKSDFDKKIQNLDYILYFYPTDSYKLIASGAFFDALAHRKPIIALKNDFFEYYFNKYGEIGYLVNDIEELEMILKDNLNLEYKYDIFLKNIEKMVIELSNEKISNQIKSWWKK